MPNVPPPPPDPDDVTAHHRARLAELTAIGMQMAQAVVDEVCATPTPEPARLHELIVEFDRINLNICRSIELDARLAQSAPTRRSSGGGPSRGRHSATSSSSATVKFLQSYRFRGKNGSDA